MVNTEGRVQLEAALKKPGRSQSWLARELKIAQSSVGFWVHGKSRPESHLREILEVLLGIPSDAWKTAEERRAIRAARVAARKAAARSAAAA